MDKIDFKMRAIKDPTREPFGIWYTAKATDEFGKLLKQAVKKIEPFSDKEISRSVTFFKMNDEDLSSEYDCCDNQDCIDKAKEQIKNTFGNEPIEECNYDNDGDHEWSTNKNSKRYERRNFKYCQRP